jgi:hypothetical protein
MWPDLYLPTSGAWTIWSAVTLQVTLVKGLNALRFSADSASTDCANLDAIALECVDVMDALVAPYILVNGADVAVGWNPDSGFESVYRSDNLTNDFLRVQSNVFDGVFTESVLEGGSVKFYTIMDEVNQ